MQTLPMNSPMDLNWKIDFIHREICAEIETWESDHPVSRSAIQARIQELLREHQLILSREDQQAICQAVIHRMLGYGPIQAYLEDPAVTEIMVNAPQEVFIEREGNISSVPVAFRDQEHILDVIERIIAPVGRRLDESSPFVDARLPDGSRINAVIPPLALRGPSLTIRKFSIRPFTISRLIDLGTLNQPIARLLELGVKSKLNIVVSGGTGSGKTSTLNALIDLVPDQERLVIIEDTAELRVCSPNFVSLESRPPNVEGKGEITIQHLVRNALRMRPDRIIVGEVRGPEAFDMLQAMNTGHPGSFTTIHANSPMDAVRRIEAMVLTAGLELPQPVIREQISSAVDLILQLERLPGGERKVISLAEVVRKDKDQVGGAGLGINTIFEFTREGIKPDGTMSGRHQYTGHSPGCVTKINKHWGKLPHPDRLRVG